MAFEPDTFEKFGLVRWTTPDGSQTFTLRHALLTHTIERRIIPRRRPGLDGAPCNDTGAEPDAFDVPLLFAESDTVLARQVGTDVYPTYHARFLRAAKAEGTSTMYVPGRGTKRVRIRRIVSTMTPTGRNAEEVTLTVLEDLEDAARASADTFTAPSAKSAPIVFHRALLDSAAPTGWGGDLLSQLGDAIDAMTAAVNDPLGAAFDIGMRADRVLDLCQKMRRLSTAQVQPFGGPSYAPLRATEAAAPLRLLARIEDAAAAQRASVYGTATTRPRRFARALSIFEISALLKQPVADLIALNARLPLFGIPPGTEVIVKAA